MNRKIVLSTITYIIVAQRYLNAGISKQLFLTLHVLVIRKDYVGGSGVVLVFNLNKYHRSAVCDLVLRHLANDLFNISIATSVRNCKAYVRF